VHHDVGTVLERAAQIGDGTVLSTISGTPLRVCDFGELFEVGDVPSGLPMDSQNTAFVRESDQTLECIGIAVIGEADSRRRMRSVCAKGCRSRHRACWR